MDIYGLGYSESTVNPILKPILTTIWTHFKAISLWKKTTAMDIVLQQEKEEKRGGESERERAPWLKCSFHW